MADIIRASSSAPRKEMTAEYLRENLSYDPTTGIFIWIKPRMKVALGSIAGHITARHGYVTIRIDRRSYLAHRLAWLYVHGSWPRDKIDHRDRNPSNNRIENLREATQSQNMANARKQTNNRSGVRGVCFNETRSKWLAFLSGKILGTFDNFDEALKRRRDAEMTLHPEFRQK